MIQHDDPQAEPVIPGLDEHRTIPDNAFAFILLPTEGEPDEEGNIAFRGVFLYPRDNPGAPHVTHGLHVVEVGSRVISAGLTFGTLAPEPETLSGSWDVDPDHNPG